ncbi:MAG TPA: DinB family protein [Longimicrobiales bacterium]|nr:DinB family protein [Longimicrobiales bacterium]
MKRTWAEVVALHDEAVAAYADAALAVPAERWSVERAPGKWSPAQITQHLILAFEAAQRDIRDGVPMALRTKWYHRLVLRFTYQRRLLRQGIFPSGARAPRESRPAEVTGTAEELVARFRSLAAELTGDVERARSARPGARITHPYFGSTPLADAMFISARHIHHHRGQLPGG